MERTQFTSLGIHPIDKGLPANWLAFRAEKGIKTAHTGAANGCAAFRTRFTCPITHLEEITYLHIDFFASQAHFLAGILQHFFDGAMPQIYRVLIQLRAKRFWMQSRLEENFISVGIANSTDDRLFQ